MALERTPTNDHDPTDDLLLERLGGGDEQAMAEVFDRYAAWCTRSTARAE